MFLNRYPILALLLSALPLTAFAHALGQVHIAAIVISTGSRWQGCQYFSHIGGRLQTCTSEPMVVQGIQIGLQLVLHGRSRVMCQSVVWNGSWKNRGRLAPGCA